MPLIAPLSHLTGRIEAIALVAKLVTNEAFRCQEWLYQLISRGIYNELDKFL